MKLIFVRHGETEENVAGIGQGWIPGKLTSNGKTQAHKLGLRLKNLSFDVIYTSDLQRCLDTIKEVTKHHPQVPMIPDQRLRERGIGTFEGKKHTEVDWKTLPGDMTTNQPPNGESFVQVWKRLESFVTEIKKKHANQTVLVSTHGGPLRLLQAMLTGNTVAHAMTIDWYKNTAVSEYEFDSTGKARAILLNCDVHLQS